MRKFTKVLGLGMLSAAFVLMGSGMAVAQCDDVEGQTEHYTKFTQNFQAKDPDKLQIALDSGKVFLEKYGNCEDLKQQVDYIKPWIERLTKRIPQLRKEIELDKLFGEFDAAIKATNASQVYSVGRKILEIDPGNANVIMVMGGIGLDEAIKGNFANVDESLRYAKVALDCAKNTSCEFTKKRTNGELEAGAFHLSFTRKEAVDQMTYVLGYLHYQGKKDKKAALPYYYELIQTSDRFKSEPGIYASIASYYSDEAQRIGKEIEPLDAELTRLQKANENPERQKELYDMIRPKEALYKAYEERTLDALGRAHKFAKNTTPAEKQYRDNLYRTIQEIYKSRFEKSDGLDNWLTTATSKPMPNPLSEVTPVEDEAETTTSAAPAGGNGTTANVSRP
ncbi:hypothetical protein [Leptolyngbya sp. 7M]|uniref:hypothetical protein n=1 Tax=Leptolyngbya sp. 7M TaxID=2812896 RepID=UPI001B8CCDC8|nr:hypothetical protein [Leptolyngbya sp. 7M]QYO67989.1 hypothetical protein JVX88_15170 [Leptolyngbya sp. 7M]